MMKSIITNLFIYKSKFGDFSFKGVPVMVDSSFEGEFDQATTDYGLKGDVIEALENFVAGKWLHNYLTLDEDDNHPDHWLLDQKLSYAIMIFLGVNSTELADILGINKSMVSKVMRGNARFNHTCVKYLTTILGEEIKHKGFARQLLKGFVPRHIAKLPSEDDGQPITFPMKKLVNQ